ncbi:DUF4395 domain-containing protein [Actinokineospora sp. NPDC004072]
MSPGVDPRGPRFTAWATSAVLVGVLVSGWWPLLAAQTAAFAAAAAFGPGCSPWAPLFRLLVAPRLAPTDERADPAPLRFAQAVGGALAAVGTLGYALGAPALGMAATALALAAAFLNAAFGFCLGCQLHLLINRLSTKEVGTAR